MSPDGPANDPYPDVLKASKDGKLALASADVAEAIATPTSIDPDELEKARLEQRWRDLCPNAEQYVAQTTSPPFSG